MLNTLLHSGVGEIVAVCTRYYGGVKLGTGGLSRAYSSGVKLALDASPTELKIDRITVDVVIGYENVTDLHRIMAEMEVLVEAENYGERVEFRTAVPTEAFDSFSAAVADATRGSGLVTKR
jgi:putative IMPACT (imprinted ancient) family translation regulator